MAVRFLIGKYLDRILFYEYKLSSFINLQSLIIISMHDNDVTRMTILQVSHCNLLVELKVALIYEIKVSIFKKNKIDILYYIILDIIE